MRSGSVALQLVRREISVSAPERKESSLRSAPVLKCGFAGVLNRSVATSRHISGQRDSQLAGLGSVYIKIASSAVIRV